MTTTIWERTKTALAALTIPVAADVYIPATGTAFPDQFCVYQLIDSNPALHADGAEKLRIKRMQVTLYSRSGLAGLPDVDTLMTAAGFMRGPEREIPQDKTTRHFGLAKDYFFLEESEP